MRIWQLGRAALKSLQSFHAAERKSFPAKSRRLMLEPLEHRALLTVTVSAITGPETGTTAPAGDFAVPSGKDLYVPVTGSDAGQTINYTASSNTPGVTATVLTGTNALPIEELQLTVSGTQANGSPLTGTMTFELFSSIAPQTVAAIEADVNADLYNGAEFYRVLDAIGNQVIQGGIQPPSGVIAGKTVPANVPDEFNSAATFNSPGLLAMANGGPGTASSEFFVTAPDTALADQTLNYNLSYTIFGQILSGFNIYNEILNLSATSTYLNTPVTITNATMLTTNLQDAVVQISEPSTFTGTAQITVTGTGSTDGTTASQMFTVDAVAPVADSATGSEVVLAPITNQTTTEGKSITFQISATDETGGAPTFTVSGSGPFSVPDINSEAGNVPSGVTLPTGVTVSYAAGSTSDTEEVTVTSTTAGTFNLAAYAIDATNSSSVNDSLPFTLTVNPSLSITTTTLPNWTINRPSYSQTLAATGGTGTDSFAVTTGALPVGLTLNPTTGQITGEPTTASTTPVSFTVTATDQVGATATQTYAITINGPLSITSTVLPAITVGTSYTATIQTSGGTSPIGSFALASGSVLPNGLVLSPAGAITGIPTAISTSSFTVTATDAAGATASQTISFSINIALSPATLLNWTAGQSGYSQTLTASGGTGSYTFSSSGTLPTGLSLNGAVLQGTPTAAGQYTFTIKATDGSGDTGTQSYTVTINPPLSITTTTLPTATVGTLYNATIQTSGGTTPISFGSITLPAGLSFNTNTGVISGTPSAAGSVTFTFTVKATDASGATASQPLTLPVNIGISPATLPQWTVNTAGYSQTLTASGGTGTYTFVLAAGSTLPAGLSLNGDVISGKPTASGSTTFTVTVTDSSGNTGSQQYTFMVNPLFSIPVTALPSATVGTLYNVTVPTSGGTGGAESFALAAGTLPASLTLNSTTGQITGTPTTATTGTVNVTIMATDAIGDTTSQVVSLAVNLGINPTTLPNWTANLSGYSQQLTGSGGTTPYTFSVPAGTLPPGLTLTQRGLA